MSEAEGLADVIDRTSEGLRLAMNGHCDAVGWEPSAASEADLSIQSRCSAMDPHIDPITDRLETGI
jgi:hypothetical protein